MLRTAPQAFLQNINLILPRRLYEGYIMRCGQDLCPNQTYISST